MSKRVYAVLGLRNQRKDTVSYEKGKNSNERTAPICGAVCAGASAASACRCRMCICDAVMQGFCGFCQPVR